MYLDLYKSFSEQSLPDAETASTHAARDSYLGSAFIAVGLLWLGERLNTYILSDDISAQSLIFPAAYLAWAAVTKIKSSHTRIVIGAVKQRKKSIELTEAEIKFLDRSAIRATYADASLSVLYTAAAACIDPILGTVAGLYLYNSSKVQETFYRAAANYAACRGPVVKLEWRRPFE